MIVKTKKHHCFTYSLVLWGAQESTKLRGRVNSQVKQPTKFSGKNRMEISGHENCCLDNT